jgi:hypothetical protein
LIEDLDRMKIDPDKAFRAARFLRAYASTSLQEAEGSGIPRPVDQENFTADKGFNESRAEASSGATDTTTDRILLADAATALREAAQWLLYFDPAAARESLLDAGALYSRLELPYGYYLHVMAGPWAVDPPMSVFAGALEELHQIVLPGSEPTNHDSNRSREAEHALTEALHHPQQQAYLLLASAGSPAVADALHDQLGAMIGHSPNRDGVIPVGALGTPVRRLWAISAALAADRSEEVETIARHLAAMASDYAETMDLAQANSYLWSNAASPVDVGDLDIAGIAALTTRRYGADALLTAMEDSKVNEIGMAPVRAGIDLAIEEDGTGNRPLVL